MAERDARGRASVVPCSAPDAPLATYAAPQSAWDTANQATAPQKRTHDAVDAALVATGELRYCVTLADARPAGAYGVRLTRADAWAPRMQSGVLVSPAHVALLDVWSAADPANAALPLLTLPLTLSDAWVLAALAPASLLVTAMLHIDEGVATLALEVHATAACFAPQAAPAADALRTVVEHVNARAGMGVPPVDADAGGAALVYAALCRRESDPATQMPAAEQPRALLAPLLPFQRRSVSFLVEREAPPAARRSLRTACGPWWVAVGHTGLFFHVLDGRLTTDAAQAAADVRGAMLAEEMGLGKTVEVLALLLHGRVEDAATPETYWDAGNEAHVARVHTTLIVAPETLRRQWLDETSTHAPSLRVYSFTGHKAATADRDAAGAPTWGAWARQFDVMVVSFDTLSRELAASHAAPVRQLRRPARYERPRSPLVQLEFARVVMDEVQLVGGNAARTMGLVRRRASLAVSGTPVRRLDDLRTSLWFLGLVSAPANSKAWRRIVSPPLAPYLCAVLAQIGIRHTKAQVAHEMVLPPQTRCLVPVDFTHVETAFYRDVWHAALAALQLDADGAPLSETWTLDTAVLRAQLLRLRQACTHPQVALRGGHSLGSDGPALVNLRTIEHVLATMLEATRADLLVHRHALVSCRIYRASVLLFAPADQLAAGVAAAVAEGTGADASYLEAVARRDRLDLARDALETLWPEAQAQIDTLAHEMDSARMRGPLYELSEADAKAEATRGDAWMLAADAPHEKLRLRQQHTATLRSRQRHWLHVLHRIQQFAGHCYFQLGEQARQAPPAPAEAPVKSEAAPVPTPPWGIGHTAAKDESSKSEASLATSYTPLEDAAYAAAEATRQRLLTDAREAVELCVRELAPAPDLAGLAPSYVPPATLAGRGVLDEVRVRLGMLREHAELVLRWRREIHTRLTKPVNREVNRERENDDVYAENLDAQIEAETLLEMYRPLLAQREELLTGRIALGATSRPQLFVELDRALRRVRLHRVGGRTRAAEDEAPDPADESGDSSDDEAAQARRLQLDHFRALERERTAVALPRGDEPLTALLSAVREQRDAATRAEDVATLAAAHAALASLARTQTQLLERLRREQMAFQHLFNARAIYFKQMQELSDQVQDPDMPGGPVAALRASLAAERTARQRIGATEGRLRYLWHLEEMQGTGGSDEARHCYICTNEIETGVLTNACGHLSCESCFHAWMRSGHRTCPMCKTRLAPRDVHRVIYRRHTSEATPGTCAAPSDMAPGAYRLLPAAERAAIAQTSVDGRYGSKLDLLVQHLVHLRRTTGEKSLVFSSFARGLDLVAESLRGNGVPYVRLEGTGGKRVGAVVEQFQHAADVHVLLLHSEVQSAGLNLLAATHLFLLEPLMNHALELQAIGRVHRIGQTRPTHVYCYMVNDTVEPRIVALAASRGQSLYVEGAPHKEDDSAALQAATLAHIGSDVSREARRGDLIGSPDDLLACLFQQHLG